MAYWIVYDRGFGGRYFKCSDCGEGFWDIFIMPPDYDEKCPCCGEEIDTDANVYID